MPRRISAIFTFVLGGCYSPEFSGLACRGPDECGGLACRDGVCVSEADSDAVPDLPRESTPDIPPADPVPGRCCESLDILFVIDQSMHMDIQCFEESFAAAMNDAGDAVMNSIVDNVGSYHIGFTTASIVPENPPPCQVMGSLLRGKPGDDCFAEKVYSTPYLDERSTTADAFKGGAYCLLKAGSVKGGPAEQEDARPVQAMFAALDPERSEQGGCNQGFVREGAPLLTFFFTDSDQADYIDGASGSDPFLWWEMLLDLRKFGAEEGRRRLGLLMVAGPDVPPDPALCDAEVPGLLSIFYQNFHEDRRARADICGLRPEHLQSSCGLTTNDKLAQFRDFLTENFAEMICALCEA